MKTDQLDYELPSELIAQEPAAVRSESRLLVLARSTGTLIDSRFSRLADFLRPGDCLVLNDTKVLPARFFARRTTGGRLEGLFLHESPAPGAADQDSTGAETMNEKAQCPPAPTGWHPPAERGGGLLRGEGVPPLRVAGILPAIRGQDDLATNEQGQDDLATEEPSPRPSALTMPPRTHEIGRTRVWEVMLKGARKVKLGESVDIEDRDQRGFCAARVLEKKPDGVCLLEVETQADAQTVLNEVGFPPLPPYIRRDHDPARAQSDRERYQTVYARYPGAVAAPTAGLHFTDELIGQLKAAGVGFAHVTLHVGAGTFKPIATEQVEQHEIHSEWYRIDAKNADLINATHRKGGRVIAVGTTAMRVLETVASIDHVGWASAHADDLVANAQRQHGLKLILQASEGTTSLFIRPGYEFKIADAMITNFHLPRSTLLALVSAFAGLENTLAAYRHAIEQRYRFYSYGDAMLIA